MSSDFKKKEVITETWNRLETAAVDKYIKMLLIKLSGRYRIIFTHKMFWSDEKERLTNIFNLRISNKGGGKLLLDQNFFGKRDVVSELMKWVGD